MNGRCHQLPHLFGRAFEAAPLGGTTLIESMRSRAPFDRSAVLPTSDEM
jgi:hypothetical protein